MYDPGADAAARYPDWRIIRRPLHGAYGVTVRRRRLIIIDAEATKAEWNCTLAHELVHLDRGDRCTLGDEVIDIRRETSVALEAARRLVCPHRLAECELVGRAPAEIAEELGVDVDTLHARVRGLTAEERDIVNGRVAAKEWGAA